MIQLAGWERMTDRVRVRGLALVSELRLAGAHAQAPTPVRNHKGGGMSINTHCAVSVESHCLMRRKGG